MAVWYRSVGVARRGRRHPRNLRARVPSLSRQSYRRSLIDNNANRLRVHRMSSPFSRQCQLEDALNLLPAQFVIDCRTPPRYPRAWSSAGSLALLIRQSRCSFTPYTRSSTSVHIGDTWHHNRLAKGRKYADSLLAMFSAKIREERVQWGRNRTTNPSDQLTN